jgi:hypothetical protein
MESTQSIKPELLSTAQPPKVAGYLFQVRSPNESVEEKQGNSFTQAFRSNHNPAELDICDGFETQGVKKQFAGLW